MVHPLEVFTGVLHSAAAPVFVATANLMTDAKTRPCKLFLSALESHKKTAFTAVFQYINLGSWSGRSDLN